MKKLLIMIVFLFALTGTSFAQSGEHIEPVQPYEYTEGMASADQDALKCAQLTAALVLSLEVITVEAKNDRGLAEVACMNAYKTLETIRKKLTEQPYDPSGLTVNPNP